MDYQDELKVAIEAAKMAGKIINDGYSKIHNITTKADKSLVSEIDNQAEEVILSLLKKNFPRHSFLGEETGKSGEESEYLWITDPLDGTTNYLSDIPFFSTTVCLVYKKQPVVSVILCPFFDQLFTAKKDEGSFLNGSKIHVSQTDQLASSIVAFTRGVTPEIRQKFAKIFANIEPKTRTTRILGGAVMQFALVASGKIDALVNVENYIWDCVSGALLIQEAGGKVTDLSGEDWDITKTDILVSNGTGIHQELLDNL